jgi:hypothetical protein
LLWLVDKYSGTSNKVNIKKSVGSKTKHFLLSTKAREDAQYEQQFRAVQKKERTSFGRKGQKSMRKI